MRAEVIKLAYDRLVDLGETDWLTGLRTGSEQAHFGVGKSLRHLAIFFDDGPFYEFVCNQVWLNETLKPVPPL